MQRKGRNSQSINMMPIVYSSSQLQMLYETLLHDTPSLASYFDGVCGWAG